MDWTNILPDHGDLVLEVASEADAERVRVTSEIVHDACSECGGDSGSQQGKNAGEYWDKAGLVGVTLEQPISGKRMWSTEKGVEGQLATARSTKRGKDNVRRTAEFHRVLWEYLDEEYERHRAQGTLEGLWMISKESSRFQKWGRYQWGRVFFISLRCLRGRS